MASQRDECKTFRYSVGDRISFIPGRPRWWRHPILWWRWPKEQAKLAKQPKYAYFITSIEPGRSITIKKESP